MILKPSENPNLFEMNFFFHQITSLYNEKKLPNNILLSGKKGLGKSTLAYHIVNYILSNSEDYKYNVNNLTINQENRSFKLIQNNSHQNFYLIDVFKDKKNIDVTQIREMIKYTNKSTFNNKDRFILIDNIEKLNLNSINALLKIIEEPNKNIFFILINNNEKFLLPTLKSRCLLFKINFTLNQTIDISNKILKENIFDLINIELINYYITPGEIINLVNFAKNNNINLKDFTLVNFLGLLINNGYYKKNNLIKKILTNFIELFFLKEFKSGNTNKTFLDFYHNFITKIHNTEKYNLDEESVFLEFRSKLLHG